MNNYECKLCNFSSQIKCNYNRHLTTKKHLQKMSLMTKMSQNEEGNEEIEEGKKIKKITVQNQFGLSFFEKNPHLVCQFCQKTFSRKDNLRRHISVCKLNAPMLKFLKVPKESKIEGKKINFRCQFCQNDYQTKSGLNRHLRKCALRQKSYDDQQHQIELLQNNLKNQQKAFEMVSKVKPSQITNNITNNKTINYLNNNLGEMIEMEKFLYNLQHTEQLTHHEREMLLVSYKDNGIELFARSFSHIMKENCRRQLLKEGLPDFPILPLYCSDGNLRSHKEKDSQGWKTHYDNQSINTMINISSDQVYQSHRHPLFIDGRERKKVFKQVKQDNHAQNFEESKLIIDNNEDS